MEDKHAITEQQAPMTTTLKETLSPITEAKSRELWSISDELTLLRGQVAELTKAVRGLVQLQAIANQKLDSVIRGNADCAVL